MRWSLVGCTALVTWVSACGSGSEGPRPASNAAAGASTGGLAATAGAAAQVGGAASQAGAGSAGGASAPTTTGGASAGGAPNAGMSPGGGSGAGSAGMSSAGSPPIDVGDPEILSPEKGALLGQFYGDANIAATTAKLGRALPLHLTYYAFDAAWYDVKPDLDAGRIPFVNWEPFDVTLADIAAGVYDQVLAARAKQAVAAGGKFFVDFGAEMNGDWSPWSGAQNGNDPAKYIAAYRHVHDELVGAGATNIIWAWCPNVTDEPRQAWNDTLSYYPGDDYVDWTCVDGYNWGGTNDIPWQSFRDVFAGVYAKLATKKKPILIGEMASAETGGNKAEWIVGIVPALRKDFPLIKGLIWFDIDKEADWRISSSPAAEAAFVAMASDPYFKP